MQQHQQHEDTARRLIGEALDDEPPAPAVTAYRDPTPARPTGAPPVPQPGRPPMSQRAADISGVITAAGIAALPLGGGAALTLWALSAVDPVVLAVAAAAPAGLVGTLGIAARMIGRAAQETAAALPPGEVHHHHAGPVHIDHTEVRTITRGLGRTINRLPAGSERSRP